MLALLLLNQMNARRRDRVHKPSKVAKSEDKSSKTLYCRTCLATEDLMSIFYNKENEEKRSHDLNLVTGLEIKMDDGLSQKICARCVDTMNMALQFRRTSRKSEKALLNMIAGKPPKKKYSSLLEKSLKPKVEDTKVEKMDMTDYSYEIFGDQFQDQDDDYQLPVKKKKVLQPSLAKKKRMMIPNMSSYKCGTCSKEFKMKATYKAHMRFHTNYCVCEACGKRCRNNNQLQEHKRARHGLYKIHKCAYCEYSSATKEALTIHERRHTGERPYVCDHCGGTFHRRSNLVQHIAIHLPERNFQCDMCPKKLKSRKFLQIHKHNAHTGKRYGYLCGICDHRFEKPNKVRAHTRRVHGIPDEQQGLIARCKLCKKREKSKKRLQDHVYKVHRERRYRYVCPACRECYKSPGYVRRHLTRAHGVARQDQGPVERIKCKICNKAEKSKKRLRIHMYQRHREGKYRYMCPRCPKTYQCSYHVRRHLVNFHNLPRSEQGPVEKYVIN